MCGAMFKWFLWRWKKYANFKVWTLGLTITNIQHTNVSNVMTHAKRVAVAWKISVSHVANRTMQNWRMARVLQVCLLHQCMLLSELYSECKDLMKVQLCLNVIDFCDVFLVANYCCESCRTESFRRPSPIASSHVTADGGGGGGGGGSGNVGGGHKTSYTRIPRVRRVKP